MEENERGLARIAINLRIYGGKKPKSLPSEAEVGCEVANRERGRIRNAQKSLC